MDSNKEKKRKYMYSLLYTRCAEGNGSIAINNRKIPPSCPLIISVNHPLVQTVTKQKSPCETGQVAPVSGVTLFVTFALTIHDTNPSPPPPGHFVI